ncbi:MAG: NADP-dependent malic enzyme [Clostridia bacterium]|nr:NADP-dependent malic enzyme [Clostridia bacterium]
MNVNEMALKLHQDNKGKISVESKVKINTKEDLSLAYTPGVAEPCRKIDANKEDVYKYTSKGNLVAVVSDGSAVLGLGNIGPEAAMPVMEGKAILFKEFAGVDGFPICLDTQDTEEIIKTVKYLAPTFGGINLEDISAPRCFEIEERLKKELDIPVFHDDQHGTAVCVLAAIINACKVIGKNMEDLSLVLNGVGAAGTAVANILLNAGITKMYLVDKNGILNPDIKETMLHSEHEIMAKKTNPDKRSGDLAEALKGVDAFVGVSAPGLVTADMVKTMNKDAIVIAMANPTPEIMPDEAKAGGARVIGTGRSDFPNQVNNVLAFPGIFKGALEVRSKDITEEMKIAAAYAIAGYIPDAELNEENIMPKALDKNVASAVAKAVADKAREQGVNRV